MGIVIPREVKELLDGPNFAHLATLMPDGSPQSVPVWIATRASRRVFLAFNERCRWSMARILTKRLSCGGRSWSGVQTLS